MRSRRPLSGRGLTLAGGPLLAVSLVAGALWAAPAAQAESTLVFATFNVCKQDCAAPAPSWDVRRERVARVIVESSLDVVGLQEVTHWQVTHAKTQFQDVQNLVAPHGFVSPTYTNDSDECRWTKENPRPCTHTTGLLFKTSTVEQVSLPNGMPSAGTLPASRITTGLTAEAAPRKVAWAYLRGRNGAGPFLALSIHTSTFKDAANEASRIALGDALTGWAQAWNDAHGMPGAPIVLMGDLNSYAKRQPQGIQKILTNAGWLDAATAPVKRNVQYSTINYNPLLGDGAQGFPGKPYVFKKSKRSKTLNTTRIDYILALGAGVRYVDYEVVIRLNPDLTFIPDYQASDHQMVRATIALPAR